MNRKHNPILSLVALVLLAMILALVCIGCAEPEYLKSQESPEATAPVEPQETVETVLGRFSIEMQMKFYGTLYIITDNETGIQYLAFETSNGVGMTQLLPGEG